MTKETFLKKLEAELQGLDADERADILAEYREHFELALEAGRDESGVALALGNPKTLAKEIRASVLVEQAQQELSMKKLFQAIFTAASLGLFNLLIVAGPFVGLLGLWAGMIVVALAFLVSPLIELYMNGFPTTGADWLQLLLSLVLAIVGYFLGRGMIWVTKWMYRWLVRYLAYNIKLVKGKSHNEA
ncbi:HAAS signaling domain-containing protein [Tumebacillus flagellatus]|uniref:DUF1700 domain-containing protein n=1 Tax=Tumebacillus flagellatus TaxID=1157490 RepID=A0A074LKR7_9BACL|nr:DUF1700 domain-containing protein [Tumebacillus flagellatus]KEO82726.1 hypothetical protein EL26_14265 [Tumebacillus flagellatus]